MVTTFVRLKLRLYANAFRNGGASRVGVLAGVTVGVIGIIAIVVGARFVESSRPTLVDSWTVIFFAIIVALWMVVPLSTGYTDATIDPQRLLSVPLDRRQLMMGLFCAALTGIIPIVTGVALLAVVLLASSVGEVVYVVCAALLATGLCVAVAQTTAAAVSGMVRRQTTRNAATILVASLAGVLGLAAQFSPRLFDFPAEQIDRVASWARWLPGGWIGQGIVWARTGQWLAALGVLVAITVAIGGLVSIWGSILDRMLVAPVERLALRIEDRPFIPRYLTWLPEPVGAATSRSVKLLRRDNREWAAMLGSMPLLVAAALPLLNFRPGEATLLLGGVGAYGGLLNGALLTFDGPAIWLDQHARPSLRALLLGKLVSRGLILLPVLAVSGVALAAFTGGWRYLPAGFAAAVFGFGVMSAFGIVGSIRYATAAPENVNLFGGQADQSRALLSQTVVLFVSILASGPMIGLLVALSLWQWWAGLLFAPVAFVAGLYALWRGANKAASEADTQGPELLARLQLA